MQPFGLHISLPAGPTLVEASAGTGKTWSIARLVARLLVEPAPGSDRPLSIRELLVVTFTKAATAELRDRIRALLVLAGGEAAERARLLRAGEPVPAPDAGDGLGCLLGSGEGDAWRTLDVAELDARLALLRAAIADFDTAAISTIHGFCQRVLRELSFESGAPFAEALVDDARLLIDELVDDWLAAQLTEASPGMYRWLTQAGAGGLKRKRLQEICKAVIAHRDAPMRPQPLAADAHAAQRAAVEAHVARVAAVYLPQWNTAGAALVADVERRRASGQLSRAKIRDGAAEKSAAEVERWLRSGGVGPFPDIRIRLSDLTAAAKKGVALQGVPEIAAELDRWAAERSALASSELSCFASWARAEHTRRMRLAEELSFDDMLVRVRDGLRRPGVEGTALLAALRQKFRAALIDEFQDTDAVQWEVFQRIFCESPTHRLILIGDPKQAIYSFRGADIAVYERACEAIPPHRQFSMTRNFRSDARLIAALNAMWSGGPSPFLTESIRYEAVAAAQPDSRLFDADDAPAQPVVLRWVGGTGASLQTSARLAELAVRDAAVEIAALLRSGRRSTQEDGTSRAVRAGDIAVLVATNARAREMRAALVRLGVAAVLSQAGSVFESEEAWWMQTWLEAVADPASASALRAFAATPLGGMAGPTLVAVRAGDSAAQAEWQAFVRVMQAQAQRFARSGIAAGFSVCLSSFSGSGRHPTQTAMRRLAQQPSGERSLTNLRHLVELLTAAQLADRLDAAGLSRWLLRQRHDAEFSGDAALLRLETDAEAVSIMTLHRSKGLQFPIVFLPDLFADNPFGGRPADSPLVVHDAVDGMAAGEATPEAPRAGAERVLELTGLTGATPPVARQAWIEALQERQRLLYVALTRAEWQVVVYAGPSKDMAKPKLLGTRHFLRSPLGLLLQPPSEVVTRLDAVPAQPQTDVLDLVFAFAERVNATCGQELCRVEVAALGEAELEPLETPAPSWQPPAPVSGFVPDAAWRRESYTGLIASRHGEKTDAVPTDLPRDQVDERPGDDELADAPAGPDAASEALAGAAADLPTAALLTVGALQTGVEEGAARLVVANPAELTGPEWLAAAEVPLRRFPGGANAGKWVHEVMEHLHFAASPPRPKDPTLDLAQLIRRHGLRNGFSPDMRRVRLEDGSHDWVDADALLASCLPDVLQTPLGAAAANTRLADLTDHARLDELQFDLPVGDAAESGDVSGAALADALAHRADGFSLPGNYLDAVRQMQFRDLRGFLTGTMDLVFCAQVDGAHRWFVVDYKTNLLGPSSDGRIARSQPQHYTRPWMEAELARKHYYIQYLLYLTALHRYLTLRLAGYRYEEHMGGALYLFVRGMPGSAATASDCAANQVPGVYFDLPPKTVIERLSAVLAGQTGAATSSVNSAGGSLC